MKSFLVLLILTPQVFAASTAEEKHYEHQCAGQMLNAVDGAHRSTKGTLKKVVFSPAVDKAFDAQVAELRKLEKQVRPGTDPDKALLQKMAGIFDQTTDLSRKHAFHVFDLCLSFLRIMSNEARKLCPKLNNKSQGYQDALNKCVNDASKTPPASKAFDEYNKALLSMLLIPKK